MNLIKLTPYQRYYLDFLFAMTEKEIKARYKFAVLGFLWIVLNPLLQMLVMGFVFQFFVPVQVNNYFLFLFTGLLPWNFFSMTVTKCTPAIMFERSLIQKAKFPRESIVLSILLSNLFHFLIAFGLLLIVLTGHKIFFEQLQAQQIFTYVFNLLWLIPLIFWLILFTTGMVLFTSALNVKYRDVNFVVGAVMPLWFYITPVVYQLKLLPEKVHWLFIFNPMISVIEGFHVILLNQSFTSNLLIITNFIFGLLIFVFGWLYFQKAAKYFDDWM